MNASDETTLAETLRAYLVEHCPALPVRGGALSLDDLLPEAESMALRLDGGGTERQFIDDTRIIHQPFTLFYRAPVTEDNEIKSAMLGALNAIGAWMDGVMRESKPYLGDWLTVNRFEQVRGAAVWDQDEKFITYQAGYALGYETTL